MNREDIEKYVKGEFHCPECTAKLTIMRACKVIEVPGKHWVQDCFSSGTVSHRISEVKDMKPYDVDVYFIECSCGLRGPRRLTVAKALRGWLVEIFMRPAEERIRYEPID